MPANKDDDLKTVRFFYYRLMVERNIDDGKRDRMMFDLSEWSSNIMADLTMVQRNFPYGGDEIRLQSQSFDEVARLLLLRFNRLTVEQSSFIANFKDQSEKDFDLPEDEYIANDVSCIFDIQNGVLMVQRNIKSLSIKAISEYINHFWNLNRREEDEEIVQFEPIASPDVFKQVKRNGNKYKKISVKTGNKYSEVKKKGFYRSAHLGGLLEKAIDVVKPAGNLNFEFELDAGRSSDSFLDEASVHEILDSIQNHPSAFSKAYVKYENDMQGIEVLNLLNALLSDSYQFKNPPKSRLRYDVVLDQMKAFYIPNENNNGQDRRTFINKLLG